MPVDIYKNYKKNTALRLRKEGKSYSEIRRTVDVPKSTLTFWFKNLKLEEEKLKNIQQRGDELFNKRIEKINFEIERLKKESSAAIKSISKRELWLMGIILYWRERLGDYDIKNGVRFSSDDPHRMRLFTKWLNDIGNIKDEELLFDIFLKIKKGSKTKLDSVRASRARIYWSKILGFPIDQFSRVYVNGKKKKVGDNDFGFIRVRVAKSSMLARQISGWIEGIKNSLEII
jgi:hypothetical protein